MEKYLYIHQIQKKAVQALDMIEDIVRDVEVGGIYYGEVTRIMPFGHL